MRRSHLGRETRSTVFAVLFGGLIAGCAVAALGAVLLARHLPAQVDLVTLRVPSDTDIVSAPASSPRADG